MLRRGKINIGCLITVIILALVAYVLYIYLPIKINAAEFDDFLDDLATRVVGTGSNEQITQEIMKKAKELNIPLTRDNIKIRRIAGDEIIIEAEWTQVFYLFGKEFKKEFYAKGQGMIF